MKPNGNKQVALAALWGQRWMEGGGGGNGTIWVQWLAWDSQFNFNNYEMNRSHWRLLKVEILSFSKSNMFMMNSCYVIMTRWMLEIDAKFLAITDPLCFALLLNTERLYLFIYFLIKVFFILFLPFTIANYNSNFQQNKNRTLNRFLIPVFPIPIPG